MKTYRNDQFYYTEAQEELIDDIDGLLRAGLALALYFGLVLWDLKSAYGF